jgi:hypothetical protein
MPNFDVYLDRTYRVRINAEDDSQARRVAEWFMGHISDESNERDHAEYKFEIGEIEMVWNDAFEAEEISEGVTSGD